MNDPEVSINELAKAVHRQRKAEHRKKEINNIKAEDIKRSIAIKNILEEYEIDNNNVEEIIKKIIAQIRKI